jgi:hypothetical protein
MWISGNELEFLSACSYSLVCVIERIVYVDEVG